MSGLSRLDLAPAWFPTRDTKVQHLVSVSGGKDSTATYLLAMELGVPFRAFNLDPDNEHPITTEYIHLLGERTGGPKVEVYKADFTKDFERKRAYIEKVWRREGVPESIIGRALAILHPSGNAFVDLCLVKGRFPSRMAQFCTEELKVLPAMEQVVLPALKRGPVLQWIGVRGDESQKRASLPRWERHETGSYIWRPIHRWVVKDCFDIHKRHGLEPNPLYKLGMGRVGCMPCVNCDKEELRQIAARFPEHIDKVREWEAVVAQACKHQKSNFFAPKKVLVRRLPPGEYPGIDMVVKWSKTRRGGVVEDTSAAKIEPSQCSSKYGLCE